MTYFKNRKCRVQKKSQVQNIASKFFVTQVLASLIFPPFSKSNFHIYVHTFSTLKDFKWLIFNLFFTKNIVFLKISRIKVLLDWGIFSVTAFITNFIVSTQPAIVNIYREIIYQTGEKTEIFHVSYIFKTFRSGLKTFFRSGN